MTTPIDIKRRPPEEVPAALIAAWAKEYDMILTAEEAEALAFQVLVSQRVAVDAARAAAFESARKLILDYEKKCADTACNLADSKDETDEQMYGRADGASDALEYIAGELRTLASKTSGAEQDNWQAIDTAPKDGTDFLALIPFNRKHHQIVGCFAPGGSFVSWPGRWNYEPTHWQPLPSPPTRDAVAEALGEEEKR